MVRAVRTPPQCSKFCFLGYGLSLIHILLAAFTVLALYTFGKAVYDIGRNDGSRIVTDHAGQVELLSLIHI